jgi:hypothetical protein
MINNNIRYLRYSLLIALMVSMASTFALPHIRPTKTEANKQPLLILIPTPFRNVLFLTPEAIKPQHKIEIYSLIGELLFRRRVESVIHLPSFPKGIYLARITDESGQQITSQKIVKL